MVNVSWHHKSPNLLHLNEGVVETAMLAFGAYTVKRNRLKIYANLVIISPLLIYNNEKKKRKDGTLPFLHNNNISHLHLFQT